jgi:hypothetical protein
MFDYSDYMKPVSERFSGIKYEYLQEVHHATFGRDTHHVKKIVLLAELDDFITESGKDSFACVMIHHALEARSDLENLAYGHPDWESTITQATTLEYALRKSRDLREFHAFKQKRAENTP